MEKDINVADILKDKPVNTKLYSPLFGYVYLLLLRNNIVEVSHHGEPSQFYNNGRYFNYYESEPLLFPSKEMRDWSKFAWKKGDVLSCGVDNLCIFEKWCNDDYTEFEAKFANPNYSGNTFKTEKWSKETNEAVIKQYISNIEEFKGGKLNLTTLEIEKTQPKFKDGDIVVTDAVPSLCYSKCILILKGDLNTNENSVNSYVFYNINNNVIYFNIHDTTIRDRNIHLATEEEKQQLFDALANENKAWDAEKKEVVDLKPKWAPKPFDKVVVRCGEADKWSIDFFSYKVSNGYICTGDAWFGYCLPYNEETVKLIGTRNNVEG